MKKLTLYVILLFTCTTLAYAAKPLPLDEAFSFRANTTQTLLNVEFDMAAGYFIYQDKIKAVLHTQDSTLSLSAHDWPIGVDKYDPNIGGYTVYDRPVTLSFNLPNDLSTGTLALHYQGCSASGFCYPPSIAYFHLSPNTAVLPPSNAPDSPPGLANNRMTHLLNNGQPGWVLLSFFGFGLLLTFTPCVLPMIPILGSMLVKNQKHGFVTASFYVLGMACAYGLMGFVLAHLGSHLQAALQTSWVITGISLIFILLALSMLGFFEMHLPASISTRIQGLQNRLPLNHAWGVFTLGALSALVISPCITPPLVGALTYVTESGNVTFGAMTLFMLGLGMGAPLVALATVGHNIMPKSGPWMYRINQLFACILFGMAIWLISRIIPAPITLLLWAAWCLLVASLVGLFQPMTHAKTVVQKLFALGFVLYAGMLVQGAWLGYNNPLTPWRADNTPAAVSKQLGFTLLTDADQIKAQAPYTKPVLLDFYADWCLACDKLILHVMTDPEIRPLLSQFTLLKADVSINSNENQFLMKHFGVIAPPTLVFFDTQGTPLPAHRLVGEPTVQTLKAHLLRVLQE